MSTAQMKHSLVLRLSAVLAFGLAAGASFGYDPGDYSTWMQLKGTSARYTGSVWYDPADETQTGVPAEADKCYYVAAGKTANSEDATDAFPGVMAVAGSLTLSRYGTTHTLNDLTLLDGSTLKTSANVTHKGRVTVEGTVRYNTATYSGRTWSINADFYGEDDAVLNMGNTKDIDGKCADTVSIGGTWSNYAGTLNFTKGTYFSLANAVSPFGGTMVIQSNAWVNAAKTSGTFEVGGLRLEKGGVLMFGTSGGATVQYVISKRMEIVGGATLDVAMPANSDHLDLFKLTGEAAQNPPDVSSVTVGFVNQQGKLASDPHFVIVDNGDDTKTVRIAWTETVIRGTRYVFNPTTTPVPNSFRICSDAILELGKKSGAYDIGSLAFEDGAELCAPSANYDCAYFNVSTAISFGETFKISGMGISTNGYRIARLTGEAAANAPDVSSVQVEILDKAGELPRNPYLAIVDNGDGTKDVRVVWDLIEIMKKANGYDTNNNKNKAFLTDTPEDYWVRGVIPPVDFEGDVYAAETITFYNYGTDQRTGTTVTIADGKSLYQDNDTLYLKAVHFAGSGNLSTINAHNVPHTLYSPIVLHGGAVSFGGWGNRWLVVHGKISGTGTLSMSHGTGNTIGARVFGDDSLFEGSYVLNGKVDFRDVEERPEFYLELGEGFGFGGDFTGAAEDAWKSVAFKTYPWVLFSSDVTVTNSTRGVLVQGGATFEVASGKTLTFTEGMTYGGKLVKRGAGALVLGNETTKFLAGTVQSDEPVEGTNVLIVAEGTLEIAGTNAVNGLAVSFAEGTSLVVNPCASDDLRENGAVNVRWATPFATTAAGGKIPVVFKAVDDLPVEGSSVAICTVTADAAEGLAFDIPAKTQHRTVATAWRPNADGTKTLVADIGPKPGLLLIVR